MPTHLRAAELYLPSAPSYNWTRPLWVMDTHTRLSITVTYTTADSITSSFPDDGSTTVVVAALTRRNPFHRSTRS
jgi:hypothetical protein